MALTVHKERQRRFTRKVRTACKTCKRRRIKCDEFRPSCQRCASSGRVCEYETENISETSTAAGSFLTWTQPAAQLSFDCDEEQNAFQFFQIHVLENLPGPYDPFIWNRYVLPISTTEPSVRHAIIALGSVRGLNDDERRQELDHFAVRHYSKAMKALNAKIGGQQQASAETILAACLLFIAFELQQSGYDQSMSHLHGGVKVIKELLEKPGSFPPLPKQDFEALVEAFERLDIQMSLFRSSRVQLNQSLENAMMPSLPAHMTFRDVAAARRPLNIHMAAMRELVHAVETHRFSPNGLTVEDCNDLQVQLTRQLVSLKHWEQAMEELLLSLSCSKDRKAARILQAHQIVCKLKVSASLSDGREMLWDSFHSDFKRLLDTTEDVLTTEDSRHRESRLASGFSLDMGIIAPLYFASIKCRDPKLRRRAITLLTKCKHQEGAWNGPQTVSLSERILKLEEEGLGGIQESIEVPETSRLYQAWYDLRHSDKVLYCKRRRFESDGDWIEYQKYVA